MKTNALFYFVPACFLLLRLLLSGFYRRAVHRLNPGARRALFVVLCALVSGLVTGTVQAMNQTLTALIQPMPSRGVYSHR